MVALSGFSGQAVRHSSLLLVDASNLHDVEKVPTCFIINHQ